MVSVTAFCNYIQLLPSVLFYLPFVHKRTRQNVQKPHRKIESTTKNIVLLQVVTCEKKISLSRTRRDKLIQFQKERDTWHYAKYEHVCIRSMIPYPYILSHMVNNSSHFSPIKNQLLNLFVNPLSKPVPSFYGSNELTSPPAIFIL